MRGRALVLSVLIVAGVVVAPPPVAAGEERSPEASVRADWRSTSVGWQSSCGIKTTGRLYCWGVDDSGLLGDGAPISRSDSAVQVRGAATDWAQVSVGGFHACAVKTTGTLWCWGGDGSGQVGDGGGSVDRPGPVRIGSSSQWASVSAGYGHTCALRRNGSLWCWGSDGSEQLGLGTAGPGGQVDRYRPERLGTATDWQSVSAGHATTCAVKTTGRLYCWGADTSGIVGNGATTGIRWSPDEVEGGGTNWSSVSVGYTSACGRRTTGRIFCWGANDVGQLGTGDAPTSHDAPLRLAGTDWVGVTVGEHHACGRRTSGQLSCWGGDDVGQLGDDPAEADQTTPVGVSGAATDWRAVDVGRRSTCAVKTGGRLLCWGAYGQLGTQDPVNADAYTPVTVKDAFTFTSVVAGALHTCGTTTAGRLYCWGDGERGELGNGDTVDQPFATQVSGGHTTWTVVALGGGHTCGIRSPGRLYCWGEDDDGELGDGGDDVDRSTPVEVAGGFSDWTDVAAGGDHTCARREVGRLYCWGRDTSGRLGNGGTDVQQDVPTEVSGGLTTWSRRLAVGEEHTCAIRTGRLYCWGEDEDGQLGTGIPVEPSGVPMAVGGSIWAEVTAGVSHTCARRTDGRLYCWGDDEHGQLGDGDLALDTGVPVEVLGESTAWVQIDAGWDHTCGRQTSGRLLCWGAHGLHQLGTTESSADQFAPVEVEGALTSWSSVSAGGLHTCGRLRTLRAYCWGSDNQQQAGIDTGFATKVVPTPVFA